MNNNVITVSAAHALLCPMMALSGNCRAAGCMAWRWVEDDVKGYCGLAGNPETPPLIAASLRQMGKLTGS